MRLDGKQAQHTGTAFDVHSSLIFIEAAEGTLEALRSAIRRVCRQMRIYDSVLQQRTACALLLPATPFSGAQAVARRIAQLLSGFPHQLHVYHGATALLVLQRLRETGASLPDQETELALPAVRSQPAEYRDGDSAPLPYLAFLTDYPSLRLLRLLPYEMACRYQCVPVGSERKMLTLATSHWLNREVVAQLCHTTRREIFQVRCEMTMIDEVLHYWQRMQELTARERTGAHTDERCRPSR